MFSGLGISGIILGFNLISGTLRKFGEEEVSVLDYGGEEVPVKNGSGFR